MSITNALSNFWRSHYTPQRQNTHLILAGLNQKLFLNQWGEPEIKISLDQLQGSYAPKQVSINNEINPEDKYTVWIYEKKDRIIFFKRGSLISHFKLSEFKDRLRKLSVENSFRPSHKSRPFFASSLAFVA